MNSLGFVTDGWRVSAARALAGAIDLEALEAGDLDLRRVRALVAVLTEGDALQLASKLVGELL